jgi:hypothetical protein
MNMRGIEMTHYTMEEWIDFVNQVTPTEQQAAMQAHLQGGCERCAKEVSLWGKVRGTAAKENALQPPADVLRVVKAAFGAVGLGKPEKQAGSAIEVLFDSVLQPALAGARSLMIGSRQMLYRAGSYQVDVQIEVKAGSNTVLVAGQIMDVSAPDFAAKAIPVTLSSLRGHIVYTVTNEFGEFRAEIENSGDLELSIPRLGEQPITISLRNALGDLPGEKA